jgi:hypothetical protein
MNSSRTYPKMSIRRKLRTNLSVEDKGLRKLDIYFAIWALVLPITSVVVVPSVPGTTLGYIFAFLSVPVALLFAPKGVGSLLYLLAVILVVTVPLIFIGQFGLLASPSLDISKLPLVNPYGGVLVLRSSLFTQSLYLLAGILTFAFVATFYRSSWDRYLLWGATFLATYGFYEFFFYLALGQNGDFLSNRVFFRGSQQHSGSLFQTFNVAGVNLMRLKSLTGEPSMYAFTILPFWIYAIHKRATFIHSLLFVSLLLTTSTTALMGIVIYLVYRVFASGTLIKLLKGKFDKFLLFMLSFLFTFSLVAWDAVADFIDEMVVTKLTLGNLSGIERFYSFLSGLEFFLDAPLLNQLFGIGFGYVRSTDFLTTLLVNMGLIGFISFCGLVLYPILKLQRTYRTLGLKAALLTLFLVMLMAVPEYSYLSFWLFLGIAYHELHNIEHKTEAITTSHAARTV